MRWLITVESIRMKSTLFALVIFIIISCILIMGGSSGNRNNQAGIHHPNYTTHNLEGNWTLIKVEVIEEKQSIPRFKQDGGNPEIMTEWSPPVILNNKGILSPTSHDFYSISNKDLHIHGDSICWLNYPFELKQKNAFTIEADLLKIQNNPDYRQIVLSEDKNTFSMSFLGDYGLYIKETYQRVRFNDSILNILKQHKINLPLLAGTWEVFREGNMNDDGTEYQLNFPYKIPDMLHITKDELTGILLEGKTYQMITDGKKRNYTLTYNNAQLILSPAGWLPGHYKGDTQIYLNRLNKEQQQLSPQECWKEFLQVITSGNISGTIDLMTDDGYNDLRTKINPLEMEITLKQWGHEWQDWEISWKEISTTHASARLGPTDKEKYLEFIKVDGLWKINVFTNGG
jgi:hypothetical protein